MIHLLYIGNNLEQASRNPSFMRTLGPLLEGEGYRLHYASSKRYKVVRLLDMLLSVFKYSKSIDAVLIDTYSTQNFYYAFLVSQLCRLLKILYVPILHGGQLQSRLQNNPRLSGFLFKHAKVNIAPSLFIKTIFENYGYSNIRFIPNTLDLKSYPFKVDRGHGFHLLWVRSFSTIYNPMMAVKVLKVLRDQGFEASLCMVGPDSDGSLKDVQSLAETLNVKVKFTGKLSKQDWIQLSEQYNYFINTTTVDNMPVSVLEAMALGLPVVSTNVGGMPYLIEDNVDALLVPNDSVDDMVSAITMLYKDESLRNRVIHNARFKVEQFDWANVKQAWNEVLKDL